MSDSSRNAKGLVWTEEYSVGVKELDDQHKELFRLINDLMRIIVEVPSDEDVRALAEGIVQYKVVHFATEERYFHLFHYEGTAEHEAAHRAFDKHLTEIQAKHQGDSVAFAFALVEFLENWMIGHMLSTDKKYTKCFQEHGLK